MTYSGFGLNNLSAYLIECSREYLEEMYYAAGYLPYYFLYRTAKGVLLFIKSTTEDVSKFSYMIKGLNEIRVVVYSNRFQNMGSRGLRDLREKWDETRQRWVCTDSEFDFVRRYELLP
jgi:hypothetical protein